MATIPMGNFGQTVARPATGGGHVNPGAFGGQVGRAIEQIGDSAQQIVSDMQRQQMAEAREQERIAKQARDEADRAKSLTVLNGSRDQLTDLRDEVGEGVLTGTIPKDQAQQEYSKRATKILEQAGTDLPEQHRAATMAGLNSDAMRMDNSLRKVVTQRDKQDVTAGISQTLEYLQRQYKTDPAKTTQQAMDTVDQLGPHSTLNPDQLARMKQGWKEGAQYTTAFEAVTAGRDDRKKLAEAQQVISTGLPDLDPQKRASLLDRVAAYQLHLDQKAEMVAQRTQREAERRLKLAEAEFQTFQGLADKGTALTPEYIDRAIQTTSGTPYQAGIQALAKQAQESGGLAAQPVPVQRATLDTINSMIATGGRNPELDRRKEQIEKVLRGSEGDLQKDGLRAGLERGVIGALRPLDATSMQGVMSSIADRTEQAGRVSMWAGRPVSPFTTDEAQQMGRTLKNLPADQRSTAIATLAGAMPPLAASALARQIDEQDRPLALALAMSGARTTAGRYTSELVLKGAEAIKNKTIKEEKTPVDGWMGRISSTMAQLYPNPQQSETTADAAKFILAGLVSEGASGSEGDVRQAVRLAVGGAIVEHNGGRIVLPAGTERSDLYQRLQNYPAADLGKQLPDGTIYASGQKMPLDEFLRVLPSAQLRYAGRGKFNVMAGGSLVSNAKNQPIVIEVPNAR